MLAYLSIVLFCCSVTESYLTLCDPWTAACQASLSITISQSLLKFMSIELVMPSNHFIFCHPLLLLPSIFPSIRVFSNDSCGQIIRASASASVLPINILGWYPLGLTGLFSLQSKGLSRIFSSTTTPNHQFFSAQFSLQSNSHINTWLLDKPYLWLYRPLSAKWCLCFWICYLDLS